MGACVHAATFVRAHDTVVAQTADDHHQSFFLWSSIPDDELLALAERGALSDPATLDRQVRRMVDDPRSEGAD